MKKYLIGALLCALVTIVPLAAQTSVSCDGCTHVVSYYMGEGGLIATAAEDAEMVNWLASCGGVTRTGMLTPNDDGVVSTLFSGDLACAMDGGKFEIGPVMDGGWYWITDADNSAVGGLVDMDILDNDHKAEPTGAGDGVTMTMGTGATFLKETSTGRVGILPTILPTMDMEPAAVNNCSYTTANNVNTRETANCMLGDGGATLLVQGPTNVFTGKRSDLGANAMVTRPASGSVTVQADLWGNGSGHFLADAGVTAGTDANLGHEGGTRLDATIAAALAASGPGTGSPIDGTGPDGTAGAGLTFDATTTTGLGVLTITADPAYCNPTAKPPVNHTATVAFSASLTADQKNQVVPTLKTTPATAGTAARHTIMVVCPAASANMGTELVPENPFPTDK